MQDTSEQLLQVFGEAYRSGLEVHGFLDVQLEDFAPHLCQILSRHLGADPADGAVTSYLNSLHVTDLYLAIACARGTDAGWNRFTSLYKHFIRGVASFVSQNATASDFADNVIVNLFLPNRCGQSRIASYEGRSSLATWLRVVICHQAANERELFFNNLDCLDSILELADDSTLFGINANLRTYRYERMIKTALRQASESLTERERLMLLLRYGDGLRLGHIARLLHIHQSTVTRQIEQACAKIRQEMIAAFTAKYHLEPAAIVECWEEMLSNPAYSILTLLESGRMNPVAKPPE